MTTPYEVSGAVHLQTRAGGPVWTKGCVGRAKQ